jgi:two-component system NtrC family sensor kinase
MMHDLTRFSMTDMISCSSALRKLAAGADSMEEVARRIVQYLYDNLGDAESGQRACALVRFYKTHNLGELEESLYRFARSMLNEQADYKQASPTRRAAFARLSPLSA